MTSLRATNDLDKFIIDFDKIYGPGAFAKQMEASIGVPEHLKNSNAASILLAKQIMLQEQDLKPQRPPGQIFKTVEELEKERLKREGEERVRVSGLSTSYEEERQSVLRRQLLERLAKEEEQQQQERMLVKAASKGSLGGKRTHRRKRKVVRKRYSRRLKSRSNRRGRRV